MDENGNEVLLRGYTPGGWLVMEGYMMQSEGTAGAQHEFVEKFTELVGEEKTNQFFAKWRENHFMKEDVDSCLLYTSPSPRDNRTSRMPSSA